jgi:hypothetical protein
MTSSPDTPGGPLGPAALGDIYGFMESLCEQSGRVLAVMQANARNAERDLPPGFGERSGIIAVFCRPIDLPQPPMRSGAACFLPPAFQHGPMESADLATLSSLFGHLKNICDQLQVELGPRP